MSRFRRIEIIEPEPSFYIKQTSIFTPKTLTLPPFFPSFAFEDELDFTLDLLSLPTPKPPLIDAFDTITDLIQIQKTRRVQKRIDKYRKDTYLQSLSDRVSALEKTFDRLVNVKPQSGGDRKYTWTSEIKGPEKSGVDRKYKLTAEIRAAKKEKAAPEKKYTWVAEIKDKSDDTPVTRTYTFKASNADLGVSSGSHKKEKTKDKKKKSENRVVEIEEPPNQGAVVLRQAFARRPGASQKAKGKRVELSPEDAAFMIQTTFRAYLIKRSKALRGLRELAIAKGKLKELRSLFNNFTYRRRIGRDAEERQRFSEKIIVLLLTVDAIEGADLMVRSAKRSMIDELEAMLDVVDPQPEGKSGSMRRRTFDMPDGLIQKELAAGVSEVVQLLNEENGSLEA